MKQSIFFAVFCIAMITATGFSGELRQEVRSAQSLDVIGQMFDQATDYKRIYILQELENWMKEHKVTQAPEWLPSALMQAMNSKHPMLIREAVVLIGKYKYTSFSDSLVELFRNAPNLYAVDETRIRSEIVTAVKNFNEPIKDSLVILLFSIKPRDHRSGAFYYLVKEIGQCGNASHGTELQTIAREIDMEMKKIDPQNDPNRNYGAYEAVLKEVVNAGIKIRERK
jgi:hypothetical protein